MNRRFCPTCDRPGDDVARATAPTLFGEPCLICVACKSVALACDWDREEAKQ